MAALASLSIVASAVVGWRKPRSIRWVTWPPTIAVALLLAVIAFGALVVLRGLDWAGGLHAVEHAAIALLPLFSMCDRWDMGGLSTPQHPDTGEAQVFIYDGFPGGVGLAEKGFELLEALSRWFGSARARRGVRAASRAQSAGITMSRWTKGRR